MSFIAAAAKTAAPYIKTAAPYISAGTSIIAGQQASAVGQYNQDIQNRNAQVAEQEENRLEEQNKFDLANFNNQFYQLQGETRTNILFSGADLSGSGLRILKYNAEQAQVEKDILSYNSKVAQSQSLLKAFG